MDKVELAGHSFLFHMLESHAWWVGETAKRCWEPVLLRALVEALRPGDTFLDIGSWIGPYAVLASKLVTESGKVYACEPDPVARELLLKNVAENHCTNVTVLENAVSDRDGPILLAKGQELGDSNTSIATASSAETFQVEGISLKTLCLRHAIKPDVIKMDVEGAEEKIIRGAGRSLVGTRAMFIEVHRHHLAFQGTSMERFIAMTTIMSGMQCRIIEDADYNSTAFFSRPTKTSGDTKTGLAAAIG
jgi:FkbM family methyltransferase